MFGYDLSPRLAQALSLILLGVGILVFLLAKSINDLLTIVLALVSLVSVGVFAGNITDWRRRIRPVGMPGTSVLLAYYTENSSEKGSMSLMSIKEGMLDDGTYYNVLSLGGTVIYQLQLPFRSKVHLLAIPQVSGIAQLDPAALSDAMESVTLEGDFPNYFKLFAARGQQAMVRYVLDPAAMLFTVKFCNSHNWEIIDDELYIVATEVGSRAIVLKDIERLIREIRPAVEEISPIEQQPHRMSYGRAHHSLKAKCPLCQEHLTRTPRWHECPRGHGYLLTGKELAEIRQRQLTVPDTGVSDTPVTHLQINCPVCGNRMAQTNYASSTTVIDTCPNCRYRWLDGGEQGKIVHEI